MKKKKKREVSGLILKIDDDVSIFADTNQYIVRVRNLYWYMPTLESCFREIFAERLKSRLIENKKKDMERIIEIHKETEKWLKDIFRKIEHPKT